MRFFIAFIIVFGSAAVAMAQVAPQDTRPGRISITGTLNYSARYSQVAEIYSGASGQMANLSGDFGYTSTSERHPTSITLNAGDSWGISGIGFSGGPYEDLSVSQSVDGPHWSWQFGDSISYRQGMPLGAFTPTSPNTTAEPILTVNTAMLDNQASVKLSDKVSGSTTLSAGTDYNVLDYPNGNGVSINTSNVNEIVASFELNHRLEGRNSLFAQNAFSDFMYPNSPYGVGIHSDRAVAGWSRTWTRQVSTSVSAGPQWVAFQIGTPAPPSLTPITAIPSSVGYAVNATVSDTLRFGSANATYSHGINGGGGYFYGSEVDDLSGSFTRQIGRRVGSQWSIGLVAGYRRTNTLGGETSLAQLGGLQGNFDATYGFAQASRQLGRNFSAYLGYSGSQQSNSSVSNLPASGGLLNGLWQTVTFGFGFTPPPIHLRQ